MELFCGLFGRGEKREGNFQPGAGVKNVILTTAHCRLAVASPLWSLKGVLKPPEPASSDASFYPEVNGGGWINEFLLCLNPLFGCAEARFVPSCASRKRILENFSDFRFNSLVRKGIAWRQRIRNTNGNLCSFWSRFWRFKLMILWIRQYSIEQPRLNIEYNATNST